MAVIKVTIGTVANDGTGQTLRDAFDKVNDNYDSFYNITSETLIAKQVTINPSGETPTAAEINAALSDLPTSTSILFILKDIKNTKAWFGLSDGTNWHIVAMTKIT